MSTNCREWHVDEARSGVFDGGGEAGHLPIEPECPGECQADLVVAATLAHGRNDRRNRLHHQRAVAHRDIVDLERRRRREHDVGEAGGVGEHLLVDDREHIVASERGIDGALIGAHQRRVGPLDEQHATRIGRPGSHPLADLVERERSAVETFEGGPAPASSYGAGGGRPDHARTRRAEVTGEHGEGQDRPARRPAVGVALLPPPDAQHRSTGAAPPVGQGPNVVLPEPAHVGGPVDRPVAGCA